MIYTVRPLHHPPATLPRILPRGAAAERGALGSPTPVIPKITARGLPLPAEARSRCSFSAAQWPEASPVLRPLLLPICNLSLSASLFFLNILKTLILNAKDRENRHVTVLLLFCHCMNGGHSE